MSFLGRLRDNVVVLFTEETRVTRYKVLTNSIGGLTTGQNIEGHGSEWSPMFDLPDIVPNAPTVLTFEAKPTAEGTRFTVRASQSPVSANKHVVDHTFTDTERKTFHVVLEPLALQAATNELIFSVAGGQNATFYDAVIMYTADKVTVKKPLEFTT
ncbi:MAG TPA: hypothetical protein VL916_00980 [Ilumatobacteraceae bacterium]|nr:hypothetical protein [Ilumatobacteraceae bacterium]